MALASWDQKYETVKNKSVVLWIEMYQNESFKIISKPKNPLLINIKSIQKQENVQQSGANFLANLKAAPLFRKS